MDLWQETDLRETPGLAPCAFLTNWNVRGEYLDMVLFQRSGDMLMASGAGGINEIQYAALLMMVAKATEYEPGVFTHFVANEQIYDRHINNCIELCSRSGVRCRPKLWLNPDKKNFYDFRNDFGLICYGIYIFVNVYKTFDNPVLTICFKKTFINTFCA